MKPETKRLNEGRAIGREKDKAGLGSISELKMA
jgi:hypothetical protein